MGLDQMIKICSQYYWIWMFMIISIFLVSLCEHFSDNLTNLCCNMHEGFLSVLPRSWFCVTRQRLQLSIGSIRPIHWLHYDWYDTCFVMLMTLHRLHHLFITAV